MKEVMKTKRQGCTVFYGKSPQDNYIVSYGNDVGQLHRYEMRTVTGKSVRRPNLAQARKYVLQNMDNLLQLADWDKKSGQPIATWQPDAIIEKEDTMVTVVYEDTVISFPRGKEMIFL